MSNKHVPVLPKECIEGLSPALQKAGAIFVDGTLGGAGHTRLFLEHFPGLTVLACDIDANAITDARRSLESILAQHKIVFYHGSFSELAAGTNAPIPPPWDAVLVDLGYSSNQLESADYGMSFQIDAPLDMRLRRPSHGPTAWEMIEHCSQQELADIFFRYAEIRESRSLARAIKTALAQGELVNSTRRFAEFVAEKLHDKKRDIHPATTVFQALRIAVNDELRTLDTFLKHVMLNLKKGGRLAVITFHSLEDRIVKSWGNSDQGVLPIYKKPVTATEEEIKSNPRSRSAKLRIYEKK
ncbi:MAG TPA: 16S rRNA (cytosine(1402)-N(4))-methyltransferase RsmH [Oligoflexia bacterium]|nr:16S rRNA (cytosine(1402)-N(4))-methyltransferase RsmH [Oligoflexia bacterium]